jgi:hypothetical protein
VCEIDSGKVVGTVDGVVVAAAAAGVRSETGAVNAAAVDVE